MLFYPDAQNESCHLNYLWHIFSLDSRPFPIHPYTSQILYLSTDILHLQRKKQVLHSCYPTVWKSFCDCIQQGSLLKHLIRISSFPWSMTCTIPTKIIKSNSLNFLGSLHSVSLNLSSSSLFNHVHSAILYILNLQKLYCWLYLNIWFEIILMYSVILQHVKHCRSQCKLHYIPHAFVCLSSKITLILGSEILYSSMKIIYAYKCIILGSHGKFLLTCIHINH